MFQRVIEKIAQNLDRNKIPYMVIGGQAVLLYGEPRFTKDIDVTLGIEPAHAEMLLSILPAMDFRPIVENPEEFLRETFVLPVEDRFSQLRIDFIFSLSDYERLAITRAVPVLIGTSKVNYITVDDLLIHKIIAGRPRDIEDAKSIMLKNSNHIAVDYVEKWLNEYDRELGTDFFAVLEKLRAANKL